MSNDKQEQPERLELRSLNPAEARREEIARLFPEARTENGMIDFDQLKCALGEAIDGGRERYGLVWPGKADCFKTIQAPSVATLRPAPEESVNFDTTENPIIEGDNLEVLKHLQKSYLGKVKMIYIDPPYNTGNDFIYPDKFAESLQTYLEYTGQIDSEGRKFGTNTETEGRFHSNWLNMMYPRLYLARNLLRDDGVIFVSIGEDKLENAHRLLDEIYGEENFIATVVWEKIYTTKNDSSIISGCHDYVLVYARDALSSGFGLLPRTDEMNARYTNPDNDPRGPWKAIPLYADGERKSGRFWIKGPTGRQFEPPKEAHWRYIEADVKKLISDNRVSFGRDGGGQPNLKRFLNELNEGVKAKTIWSHKEVGSNDTANREVKTLFGDDRLFSFPKPTTLIRRMMTLAAADPDAIILDCFAGSGTTGDAVLRHNAELGGQRKFILVQLPERTDHDGFPTIAEITKERVRRVIKNLSSEAQERLDLAGKQDSDLGFRVFKLAESNFKTWDANAADTGTLEKQLEMHVDHLRDGRLAPDFLFEILLKSGFPLTAKVEQVKLGGQDVFSVAGGALLICLDRKLKFEAIRAMAEQKPERVVCLDDGFSGNDQLKTNAVQTFKAKGIVFRTV